MRRPTLITAISALALSVAAPAGAHRAEYDRAPAAHPSFIDNLPVTRAHAHGDSVELLPAAGCWTTSTTLTTGHGRCWDPPPLEYLPVPTLAVSPGETIVFSIAMYELTKLSVDEADVDDPPLQNAVWRVPETLDRREYVLLHAESRTRGGIHYALKLLPS